MYCCVLQLEQWKGKISAPSQQEAAKESSSSSFHSACLTPLDLTPLDMVILAHVTAPDLLKTETFYLPGCIPGV